MFVYLSFGRTKKKEKVSANLGIKGGSLDKKKGASLDKRVHQKKKVPDWASLVRNWIIAVRTTLGLPDMSYFFNKTLLIRLV